MGLVHILDRLGNSRVAETNTASGTSVRMRVKATASPIRRMGTSVEDGWARV
jgi:hypothetical protein